MLGPSPALLFDAAPPSRSSRSSPCCSFVVGECNVLGEAPLDWLHRFSFVHKRYLMINLVKDQMARAL